MKEMREIIAQLVKYETCQIKLILLFIIIMNIYSFTKFIMHLCLKSTVAASLSSSLSLFFFDSILAWIIWLLWLRWAAFFSLSLFLSLTAWLSLLKKRRERKNEHVSSLFFSSSFDVLLFACRMFVQQSTLFLLASTI